MLFRSTKDKAKMFYFRLSMLSSRALLQRLVLYGTFLFQFMYKNMYLSHQTFHSIRKLSTLFHKCSVTGSQFLTVPVSVYDQNGTCLPCPNTALRCLSKQLEKEEVRNPLRWLPYNISAF